MCLAPSIEHLEPRVELYICCMWIKSGQIGVHGEGKHTLLEELLALVGGVPIHHDTVMVNLLLDCVAVGHMMSSQRWGSQTDHVCA
jgi:hypothetical protein